MRLIIVVLFLSVYLNSARLSQITSILGVRGHQLIGYGVIVGLKGTGDSGALINKSLSNVLKKLNINVSPNELKSKNIASVIVTTEINSFSRVGDKLDLKVSSIGDAKSISGGTLLLTPLQAVDGNTYALGQGAVSSSDSGNGKDQFLTESKVMGGATIERSLVGVNNLNLSNNVTLSLNSPNFKNAIMIQKRVNKVFKGNIAKALDSKTIKITKPKKYSIVEFIAKLQSININYKYDDKIIINEKTGTIISGLDVYIKPIVISFKGITINITAQSNSVLEITNTLKRLGATPKDIISIFNSMKEAGAILVKMEVI